MNQNSLTYTTLEFQGVGRRGQEVFLPFMEL